MARPLEGLTDSYARWRSSRLGGITDRLEQRLLLELLGSVAGKTLLDVGCGDGALAAVLTRRGARVTGLDPDHGALAAARRRLQQATLPLQLVDGRAEALPFHNDAFDIVVAVTSLCFVGDAGQAIAEMARVVKPGGRLVIGDLGRWSSWAMRRRLRGWLGDPTWRAALFRTAAELRKLVEAAGMTVIEVRGAVYYPPFSAAAQLLASADPWLGRMTTFGAAFIAMCAEKPNFPAGSKPR